MKELQFYRFTFVYVKKANKGVPVIPVPGRLQWEGGKARPEGSLYGAHLSREERAVPPSVWACRLTQRLRAWILSPGTRHTWCAYIHSAKHTSHK